LDAALGGPYPKRQGQQPSTPKHGDKQAGSISMAQTSNSPHCNGDFTLVQHELVCLEKDLHPGRVEGERLPGFIEN
jgi:hypothetical protein